MSDIVIVGAKRTAIGSFLGQFTGVPTPTITAIIELASVLSDEDLRAKARDLDALGLGDMSVEELKKFFVDGA